jgi:hypothetical protein
MGTSPLVHAYVLIIALVCREYATRMTFYRTKQFQCEVTGKSNLNYFEALESELQEARTMHSRFPEPLKSAILNAVQFRMSPSLPHASSRVVTYICAFWVL